jgi:hypothetical protein
MKVCVSIYIVLRVLTAEHWIAQAVSGGGIQARRWRKYTSLLYVLNSWQQYSFVQSSNKEKLRYIL